MSHVLTAMLVLDGDSSAWGQSEWVSIRERIDAWLAEQGESGLAEIHDHFGGKSAAQVQCYGLASKRLDMDEFVTFLRSLPWQGPPADGLGLGDLVQLVANDEHDFGVRLIEIFGTASVGTK